MLRRFLCSALFFTVLNGIGICADELPAEMADVTISEVDDETQPAERLRDPFWPAGYYPSDWFKDDELEVETVVAVEPRQVDEWSKARKMLNISGISQMGGEPMLVVNGRLVHVGDNVSVLFNERRYEWRLGSIHNGKINLQRIIDIQE
ncbi:MAG: hypothetical protein EOL87_14570 [Spartobacteria bacterium]|nr:hypothetical protein [Spartobacteria bacterium]